MSIIPSNTSVNVKQQKDLSFNECSTENWDNDSSITDFHQPNFPPNSSIFVPIKNEMEENQEDQNKEKNLLEKQLSSKEKKELVEDEDPNESDGERVLDIDNLPETVSILQTDDRKTIYLVGTSHFSKQSHRDVRRVIRTVRPKVVVLELCSSRMCFISMDEKEIMKEAKKLSFKKIRDCIKKNGFTQGLVYILLLGLSAKATNDLELAPGGEFRSAFKEVSKIPGCKIQLGDRLMDITLKRAIATLSTWQKIKIACHYLLNNEKLNEKELERYKKKEMLEQLVDELSAELPGFSKVMLDERDSYLAHSLWQAAKSVQPGSNIVGVVGIGHLAGIRDKWDNVQNIDILELVKIPAGQPSKTFLFIKYSFYGLVTYGIYRYVIPNVIKSWTSNISHQVARKILFSLSK